MSWLAVFLILFGIGASIGITYGIIKGVPHLIKSFIQGWREEAIRQAGK